MKSCVVSLAAPIVAGLLSIVAPAAEPPAGPELATPMRDKPGYAFVTSDLNLCRVTKYNADGQPFWRYDQVKPIDVWPMPDGTVLLAYLPSPLTKNQGGVRLVDAAQKTVFDYPSDDEIMSVQPLENGHFLFAECHVGKVTEMDRQGHRLGSFSVVSKPSGHTTMRQIRLTPQGTVLVAECYSHKLREYDRAGKLLKETDLRYVYYPEPLPGGRVLAGCWNFPEAQVVELDAEGKPAWQVKASELPEAMAVTHIAGVERLANGNTLVSASCKANSRPLPRTMLFEITPEKKIVWQMLDPEGTTWMTAVRVLGAEHLKAAPPTAALVHVQAKPTPGAALPAGGAVAEADFLKLVNTRCARCHAQRVRSLEAIKANRWIEPGNPERSPIYTVIGKHRKPGGTYHNLSDQEKQTIREFIVNLK